MSEEDPDGRGDSRDSTPPVNRTGEVKEVFTQRGEPVPGLSRMTSLFPYSEDLLTPRTHPHPPWV